MLRLTQAKEQMQSQVQAQAVPSSHLPLRTPLKLDLFVHLPNERPGAMHRTQAQAVPSEAIVRVHRQQVLVPVHHAVEGTQGAQ